MSTKGEHQAYVSYITSDINDTDAELATIQADVNGSQAFFTWYSNPEVQKLLTEARRASDPANVQSSMLKCRRSSTMMAIAFR